MATTAEILTTIDAAIVARISGTTKESYKIAGREITNCTLDELRALRDYYFKISVGETSGYRGIRRQRTKYIEATE